MSMATIITTENKIPVDSAIKGIIHYLQPTELLNKEKPYISSVPFSATNSPTTNIRENQFLIDIQDVRAHGNPFTLDHNGFQYVQHTFKSKPSRKIDGPNHPYIGEVVNFLKQLLRPKEVVVYDCNVRRIGDLDFFQPATSAHIDHSKKNALFRLQEALRPYNGLDYTRWQAYTVWCPLSNPITDWPLAVCDYRTVEKEDLHNVDTVLPHRVNEIYHLQFNSGHRWYYMSNQAPDEPLIMKIYDSDHSAATFCPHASFDARNQNSPTTHPRESVDVRAFVLY